MTVPVHQTRFLFCNSSQLFFYFYPNNKRKQCYIFQIFWKYQKHTSFMLSTECSVASNAVSHALACLRLCGCPWHTTDALPQYWGHVQHLENQKDSALWKLQASWKLLHKGFYLLGSCSSIVSECEWISNSLWKLTCRNTVTTTVLSVG